MQSQCPAFTPKQTHQKKLTNEQSPAPALDLSGAQADSITITNVTQIINYVAVCDEESARPAGPVIDAEAIRATHGFTGRTSELAALEAAFKHADSAAAIVHGLGGAGKSALAREFAWRNRGRYDTIWWLNAESEDSIIDGLVQLGVRSKPDQVKSQQARAAARYVTTSFLSGEKPVLLIFDNLEDERLFHAWRPRGGAHVLVTTQISTFGGDATDISLDVLPLADAMQYLRLESRRTDLDDEGFGAIAEALGNLPLALAHAAAYLRVTRTVASNDYIKRIARQLAKAPRDVDYPHTVFATFHEAIAKAEERAAGATAVICLLAFFAPDDIPSNLIRQQPDVYSQELTPLSIAFTVQDLRSTIADAAALDDALGALFSLSLIQIDQFSSAISVHRLVQAAARDQLGNAVSDWARVAVTALHAALLNHGTRQGIASFVPHVRTSLNALPMTTSFPAAADLAQRCGEFLASRGAFVEAEPFIRRALHMFEAIYGPGDLATARALRTLGALLSATKRDNDAVPVLHRALAIVETAFDAEHYTVASAVDDLANALYMSGATADGQLLYRRAFAIMKRVATRVAVYGASIALDDVPSRSYGELLTIDDHEIAQYTAICELLSNYCVKSDRERPLSLAVFGQPGSGKSFAAIQIMHSLHIRDVQISEFRLSDFTGPGDLARALGQVRDAASSGATPFIIWSDFDCRRDGFERGWLRHFISVMSNGTFQDGDSCSKVGQAVFVFASTSTESMVEFTAESAPGDWRDFVSRLKGYLEVLGPNPATRRQRPGQQCESTFLLRRAIILRSLLMRYRPELFIHDRGRQILQIDEAVLDALLLTPIYQHGVRSMEALVRMSGSRRGTQFDGVALPDRSDCTTTWIHDT